MAKEIKQKIVLEGEQEYNRAIREAQRNLKTLRSELKAETAELGSNATAQQKNEARAKSLREQIKEQEKIVKTLREALKEAREEYGDNADVVQKWEQKLNEARTTLGNMKNDLEGVGSGFKQLNTDAAAATVATKSVADAVGAIGDAGEGVASAIEGIFSGIISTIESAARRTWELIAETAAKANNWTDLGNIYGSSAQDIQMWSKSIEAAGGDFSKFLTIVSQLSFGGDAKEKKITELLGISKENYQDDIKYTLAVLDELEKRRTRLGQGWYDSTMSELFGTRRSADVSWFMANAYGHEAANGEYIYGWRDNPERFNGNESSFGLNDQELVTLNDVYVKMKEIETKWDDIKHQVAAGLGTAALEITTSVSGFLDGLAEYMNADDESGREAALQKMRENMERFFRGVAQIIRDCIKILTDLGEELKGSEDPATQMIGNIMTGLANALQWMIDNQDKVKLALEAIFGVWLIAKLTAVAGKLASILAQIETIKAFKGLESMGAAGAGGGAAAGAGGAGAAGAGAAGAGGGAGVVSSISGALGMVAAEAAVVAVAVTPAVIAQAQNEEEWKAEREAAEAVAEAAESMGEDATLLRQLIEAGNVKKDANGEYKRNFLGFLDMNPTDQADYILQALGDVKMRGLLYSDILTYGPVNGAGDRATSSGNYAWNELLRYWGEYTDENGRRETEPLDRQRIEALVEYLREMEINKLNHQMEEQGQRDLSGALEEAMEQALDNSGADGDLPADWYTVTGSGWNRYAGNPDENGISETDLQGFLGVPAGVESAAEKGVKKGISGLRVEIDGQAAGRILAPYVSQEIAKDME